jgi:1,2-diacylglycerol 3-alpha-glucosyltransferase
MRIGIFSESYRPLINGVSTSLDLLIAELERAGHTVYVFASGYPRFVDERPGVFRFPSINSFVEPDYVLPVPISPSIMRVIPTLGLDVIHSQSPFILGGVARRISRRYHIPHISTNHTLYTEYAHYLPIVPPSLTRAYLVPLMRSFYNDCKQVIAPSELAKRRLVDYGVTTPIEVIPTGIPEPPYILGSREATKDRLGIPAFARVLLYVGRLAPEKNLLMLMDAFSRIVTDVPESYLVVAGSGKSAGALRKRAEQLGTAHRVIFTGFLDRTRLDPIYRTADVFLFPSKTETQGLAVGEALAAGTPCVVVNGGGAPESVHDGTDGFLVDDDADAMSAAAIKLLQNDDLRRKMSETARTNSARLRPDAVAARIMALYERLSGARPVSAVETEEPNQAGPPA